MKPKTSSETNGEKIAPRVVKTDMGAAGVEPTFTRETAENSKHRFDHCHLLNQVALCSRSRSFPAATTDGFGLSKWLITLSQKNISVNSSSGFLPRAKHVQLPSTPRIWDPFSRGQRNPNASCNLGWKRHLVSTRGSQSLRHPTERLLFFLLVLIPLFP